MEKGFMKVGIAIASCLVTLAFLPGCGGGGSSSPGGGGVVTPPTNSPFAGSYAGTTADQKYGSGHVTVVIDDKGNVSGTLTNDAAPTVGYDLSGGIAGNGKFTIDYKGSTGTFQSIGVLTQNFLKPNEYDAPSVSTTNQTTGGQSSGSMTLYKN